MIERLSDDDGQKSPLKIIGDEDLGDREKTVSAMAKLDREIYPYFVRAYNGGYLEPINSIDCIRIGWRIAKLKKEPWADKKMYFPLELCEIDLSKNEAKYDYLPGAVFEFAESIDGRRARPTDNKKSDGSLFNILSSKEKKKLKKMEQ